MGLDTPFLPENQVEPLYDFGFYKVQRHTKALLINILKNFFDSINSTYKLQIPEIAAISNYDDVDKIFIDQDFPFGQRKFPFILVAIKSASERKLYIGNDNLSRVEVVETSTGKVAVNVFVGASKIGIQFIILAQSHDLRMKLAELISICFTHYYRWQYIYRLNKFDMISITPNVTTLDFGSESEVTSDTSPTDIIYVTNIGLECYVEYTFREELNPHPFLSNIKILGFGPEESGPTRL